VAAVAEEETHVARLDRDRLEQRRGARQGQYRRELLVLEERAPRVVISTSRRAVHSA
jgi:hypothetical protein